MLQDPLDRTRIELLNAAAAAAAALLTAAAAAP
jgi:hypothetical protein